MVSIDSFEFGLMTAQDMKFVPKSWGYELWIVNNEKYCGKILFIKAGHKCSMHMHKIKDEVLYVQSGECRFKFLDTTEGVNESRTLVAGEAYHVTPEHYHQMVALTDVTIFEISTQHFDDDSYRIDDNV